MASSTVTASGGGGSVRVPVTPRSDAMFVAQPLAQSYMPALRAIAVSMLYRYMGVNTGYGAPVPAASTAAALAACPTPLHMLQVTLAEWLAVYVGLLVGEKAPSGALSSSSSSSSPACSWSMTHVGETLSTATLGVQSFVTSQHQLATDAAAQEAMLAGVALPSLAALLGVLADWYGSIAPANMSLQHGDVAAAVDGLLPLVHVFRVALPPACPVRRAFDIGVAQPAAVQVRVLNRLLTHGMDANPHPCAVAVGTVTPDDMNTVRVTGATSAAPCIAAPVDAASVLPDTLADTVPTVVGVPAAVYDKLLGGQHAFVAYTLGDMEGCWWPVLPTHLSDAALLHAVLRATADTLVAAVAAAGGSGASPHALRELRSRARLLYCTAAVDAVDAAVNAAYTAQFGQCVSCVDTAAAGSAPPPPPPPSPSSAPVSTPSLPATTPTPPSPSPSPKADTDEEDEDEEEEEEEQDEQGDDDDDTAQCWAVLQEALQSVQVVPSRLLTDGRKTLTLYYTNSAWAVPALTHALDTLAQLYRRVEVVSWKESSASSDKVVLLVSRDSQRPLLRLCEQARSEHSSKVSGLRARHRACKAYTCQPWKPQGDEEDAVPPAAVSLLQQPLQSVCLSREDLLLIATCAESEPRRALATLWRNRANGALEKYTDDEVASDIVEQVTGGGDVVRGAAQWVHGVVIEIVLPLPLPKDLAAAVGELTARLRKHTTCVARFVSEDDKGGDDGGATAVCGRNMDGSLVVRQLFHVTGDDLVLAPAEDGNDEQQTVPFSDVQAWSEPPLRGLCMTITQVAVCASLGSDAMRAALGAVSSACDPSVINMEVLRNWCAIDVREVQAQLRAATTTPHRRVPQM